MRACGNSKNLSLHFFETATFHVKFKRLEIVNKFMFNALSKDRVDELHLCPIDRTQPTVFVTVLARDKWPNSHYFFPGRRIIKRKVEASVWDNNSYYPSPF